MLTNEQKICYYLLEVTFVLQGEEFEATESTVTSLPSPKEAAVDQFQAKCIVASGNVLVGYINIVGTRVLKLPQNSLISLLASNKLTCAASYK